MKFPKLPGRIHYEYEQLGRRMDVLAAEYSRAYDPKIKAEIRGLVAQRLAMLENGAALEQSPS
jgi:hypothetical protein